MVMRYTMYQSREIRVSYGIEGSAKTDERRRLAAMVVRVSAELGYFSDVSSYQVELSGNGISGWVLNLENLYRTPVAGEFLGLLVARRHDRSRGGRRTIVGRLCAARIPGFPNGDGRDC
jgi:hypothetical protein